MRDFTLDMYRLLLTSFKEAGYYFYSFEKYLKIKNHAQKFLILRHDVDRKANNSLQIAKIENDMGICSTYYFRNLKSNFNEKIINPIVKLNHEIGYHYEDFSFHKGNYEVAIKNFSINLEKLRKLYPVKTICMHGSPLSKWDNREIWKKFRYQNFGIIGEPYFDVNFNQVLYLTDTGRRWDGEEMNIRDRVHKESEARRQKVEDNKYKLNINASIQNSFHSSNDIIQAVQNGRLPNQIMMTTHPQRWTNNQISWVFELICQNIKNVLKRQLIK